MQDPLVSVIIPTFNMRDSILDLLQSLEHQSEKALRLYWLIMEARMKHRNT